MKILALIVLAVIVFFFFKKGVKRVVQSDVLFFNPSTETDYGYQKEVMDDGTIKITGIPLDYVPDFLDAVKEVVRHKFKAYCYIFPFETNVWVICIGERGSVPSSKLFLEKKDDYYVFRSDTVDAKDILDCVKYVRPVFLTYLAIAPSPTQDLSSNPVQG